MIDWQRIRYQEGIDEIPADHPDREYLLADKRRVEELTPEGRQERNALINSFYLSELVDKQFPISVKGDINWRNYDYNCFFKQCLGKKSSDRGVWKIKLGGLRNG